MVKICEFFRLIISGYILWLFYGYRLNPLRPSKRILPTTFLEFRTSFASCIIHKFLFKRSMDSAGNEGLIAVLTLLQMLRLNDIPLPVKNVLTYDFESN